MFNYNKEQIKQFTEMNRAAWNDAMPLHQKANKDRWDKKFNDANYTNQDEFELAELNRIGFKNKSIVQFCCNNGVELLSLKRLGAARCVGFDISDEAVKEALGRAKRFKLDAEYYQSDVYEIGSEFDNQFDLAYFTVGALGWLPDLAKLWQIVNRLLKPDGKILIYEQHPFSLVFAGDGEADPLKIEYPYFSTEPEISTESLDYIGNSNIEGKENVYFVHTMSDMIESLLAAGFNITGLKEYAHDISAGLQEVEAMQLDLPLSYVLTARKMT